MPITTDPAVFRDVVNFGRELLWWHTWGERFAPPEKSSLQLAAVYDYPDSFSYHAETQELVVGTGRFGPVSPEVWRFEVSGLSVLMSWLGYRMATKKGKRSSPLDEIRGERWSFGEELLQLIPVLQHTVDTTERAAQLLERVVESRLADPTSLPAPSEVERKAPGVAHAGTLLG